MTPLRFLGFLINPPSKLGVKRPRDAQRTRVYRAEQAAFMHDLTRSEGAFGRLKGLEGAHAFVRETARHPATIAAYPHPSLAGCSILEGLEITDGRGRRSAGAYVDRHAIALPTRFRMRWVALHECAHIIARTLHASEPDYAPHGHRFAGVYLGLVSIMLGDDAQARLLKAFEFGRVRHQPARTPLDGPADAA